MYCFMYLLMEHYGIRSRIRLLLIDWKVRSYSAVHRRLCNHSITDKIVDFDNQIFAKLLVIKTNGRWPSMNDVGDQGEKGCQEFRTPHTKFFLFDWKSADDGGGEDVKNTKKADVIFYGQSPG